MVSKLVWCVRLAPWVVSGLSEIPGARRKVRLFCEGLVAVDRKARGFGGEFVEKLQEEVSGYSQKVYEPKVKDLGNSFGKNSKVNDVLQSELDSIEDIQSECVHDFVLDSEQVLSLESVEVKMKCSKCGLTKMVPCNSV